MALFFIGEFKGLGRGFLVFGIRFRNGMFHNYGRGWGWGAVRIIALSVDYYGLSRWPFRDISVPISVLS